MMSSINVHGAGATDAFSARSSEGEGGVNFVLDLDQGVQEHWPTVLPIDVVGDVFGPIMRIIRVGPVDLKSLHFLFLFVCKTLIKFLIVVGLEDFLNVHKTSVIYWQVSVLSSKDSNLLSCKE